jgi:hypothetical protein
MKKSSVGFAIGNGTSRLGFDLNRLNGHGITIGCNTIFRQYSPDYVVGLDTIFHELLDAFYRFGGQKDWRVISRHLDNRGKGWVTIDDHVECAIVDINQGWNNNSGLMAAAYLSERLGCEKVYMLGIDFFLPVPEQENELTGGNAVFAPGVVYPFNKLAASNKETEFVRVGPIADYDVDFYNRLEGYTFVEYDEFPY